MSDSTEQLQDRESDAQTANLGNETATMEAQPEQAGPEVGSKPSGGEVYLSLEEVEDENDYSEEEFNQLADLYDQTLTDFVEGELVTGKVLAVNDKEVSVDIGFKSEGVIPIDEFKDASAIVVGDDIEVYLDNVEDSDGQLVLSKRKADFVRQWEKVIRAYETDEVLEGVCMRRIRGGIVVDLYGVDAFLPGSQIDVKPIRDFDALIGKTMDFKIVKVNELRKNIVVSHRALIEEGMKEQRAQILQNLEKNQILEGAVKNITDFGVFIDLGGVDGLLHINDLSWGRVSHPSEIVNLDEKIKIQILDFNEAKDRISLGLKQLQPHPWDNVKDKYNKGDVVEGKVVNIADYGAFVELEKGVEGLIHISEMSWTQHIKHPSKIVSLGEMVEAKILNLDYDGRKISLGLKQLEPDPWSDIGEKYPVDSKQKGVVRNLTNFGAFVELEEGVDGLVHISDLSWTKKIRHPGEVVKKGDEIEIVVLNIDQANRRISLGYKQTELNPWDTFEETYRPKTTVKGKIMRLIEKGVIVELPESVDGFVPLSQLQKQGIRKPADAYNVGDEITVSVIEFNKENKKIILSEKHAHAEADGTDEAGLAVDDAEAIAEYEKEMGVGKKPSAKSKTKPVSSKSVGAAEAAPVARASTDEAAADEIQATEVEADETTASDDVVEEKEAVTLDAGVGEAADSPTEVETEVASEAPEATATAEVEEPATEKTKAKTTEDEDAKESADETKASGEPEGDEGSAGNGDAKEDAPKK